MSLLRDGADSDWLAEEGVVILSVVGFGDEGWWKDGVDLRSVFRYLRRCVLTRERWRSMVMWGVWGLFKHTKDFNLRTANIT